MGRRRRRTARRPKKTLPHIFICPKCGLEAVRITMMRDDQKATVTCGNCDIAAEITLSNIDHQVDVYCRFTDRFYSDEMV